MTMTPRGDGKKTPGTKTPSKKHGREDGRRFLAPQESTSELPAPSPVNRKPRRAATPKPPSMPFRLLTGISGARQKSQRQFWQRRTYRWKCQPVHFERFDAQNIPSYLDPSPLVL